MLILDALAREVQGGCHNFDRFLFGEATPDLCRCHPRQKGPCWWEAAAHSFFVSMSPASERVVEHFLLPWLGLVLMILLALFSPELLRSGQELILLAIFILAVVPHICCDPWLPAWERGRPFILGEWSRMVLYALLGAIAMVALAWYSPVAVLVLFLLMSGYHWGTSDSNAVLPLNRDSFALGLARGGLLIHAPAVFAPTEWAALFLLLPFASELGWLAAWFSWSPQIVLICLLLEVFVAVNPSRRLPEPWRPSLYLHLTETILLVFFFWATPPWLAYGWYFLCLHHWRYVLRVGALQASSQRDAPPPPIEAMLRFAGTAAPLALVLLGLSLAGLIVLLAQESASGHLLAAGLLGLAMISPAHLLLSIWMGFREHRPSAWRAGGPPDRNLSPMQRSVRRIIK